MSRRTWTLVLSFALVAAIGLLGGFVRVPYVALGPGPTYDTLGQYGGTDVVRLEGEPAQQTGGRLTMVTVSVTDDVSLFGAMGLWASGRYALAPREEFYPPGKSGKDVDQENSRAFRESQSSAEVAALRYLNYPTKVLAGEIVKGGAADGTIEPGDRLFEVNGQKVAKADEVKAALKGTRPGQQAQVVFQRGEQPRHTAQVTLGKADDREEGLLGVVPVDRPDVPFQIKIGLQAVGGPSAGLMLALAIVDKLTPGELTGGRSIAGTGEIDAQGNVSAIGGIPFKMVAAKEAGADVFLTPAANCAEARSRTPEGLRLVKVATLADAVKVLQDLQNGRDVPGC
ncbi:YlbL family protein [Streptoalloteichus hindustanus]|uniref:endopeptidase La n=1 Tax=Streptoalloteichus hindustanus TaxID=2017 RepID=A0A1M5JBR5_STRHI|nr:PDZ domain-containing protein [Streptoalloteichus hindustanus]SHG37729.1 PDZ domain-containing protein [Streptoalloteichus hindustanus]